MQWTAFVIAFLLLTCTAATAQESESSTEANVQISLLLDTAELANAQYQYEGTIIALRQVIDSDRYPGRPLCAMG
jgi:hypothetical protein